MRSYGLGYGISNINGKKNQHLKAFLEYSFFFLPPFSAGIRGDYFYYINNNTSYLRPSAGLSLFFMFLLKE